MEYIYDHYYTSFGCDQSVSLDASDEAYFALDDSVCMDGQDGNCIIFDDRYISPNFASRIAYIVLHHTATEELKDTIDILMDRKLSAHFLVDRDGAVYRLVKEEDRAFHAGESSFFKINNLNYSSIGIEIQNNGHEDFTAKQMNSVTLLSRYLMDKYDIPPSKIVAHGDIAPTRKNDPSEYWDWKTFYNNLDVFPGLYKSDLSESQKLEVLIDESSDADRISSLQKNLGIVGYSLAETGVYDYQTKKVVQAFNRHFVNDAILEKDQFSDSDTVYNPKNQLWYLISEERLDNLRHLESI